MIEPLVRRTRVARDAATAFAHFTAGFGAWWPLATHSVAQAEAAACGLELWVGGKIWERTLADDLHVWGHLLDCEPPRALSFTWHPGRGPDSAQTIDVRFEPTAAGTEVVLEHGDWHVFGPAADHARARYATGWDLVLDRFRRTLAGR